MQDISVNWLIHRLWLRKKKPREPIQCLGYCDFVSPCARGSYLQDPLSIETNDEGKETIQHIFNMINNHIVDEKVIGIIFIIIWHLFKLIDFRLCVYTDTFIVSQCASIYTMFQVITAYKPLTINNCNL